MELGLYFGSEIPPQYTVRILSGPEFGSDLDAKDEPRLRVRVAPQFSGSGELEMTTSFTGLQHCNGTQLLIPVGCLCGSVTAESCALCSIRICISFIGIGKVCCTDVLSHFQHGS